MKTLLMSFFLSIVFFATPALSADYYGQGGWTVPIGFSAGGGVSTGGCIGNCNTTDNKLGYGYDLEVAYRPSATFSIFAEVLGDLTYHDSSEFDIESRSLQTNIGLKFFLFPASKLQPFIAGGMGNVYTKFKGVELKVDSDHQQIAFLGAGIELILTEKLTLPVKAQFSKVFHYSDNNYRTEGDTFWNVTFGLNYYF